MNFKSKKNVTYFLFLILLQSNFSFAECVTRTRTENSIELQYTADNARGIHRSNLLSYTASHKACGWGKKRRANIGAAKSANKGILNRWDSKIKREGIRDFFSICEDYPVALHKVDALTYTGLSNPQFIYDKKHYSGNRDICYGE